MVKKLKTWLSTPSNTLGFTIEEIADDLYLISDSATKTQFVCNGEHLRKMYNSLFEANFNSLFEGNFS